MNDMKICVLGGDMRFSAVCRELYSDGYEVASYGLDCDIGNAVRCATLQGAIRGADMLILPLPFSTDGIRINCPLSDREIKIGDVLKYIEKGQLVSGGKLDGFFVSGIREKGGIPFDYYESEKLSILNAIPTSEGAIAIAMNELKKTVFGSRTCVLGYGRVGKVLARMLKSLGSEVTVFCRSESGLSWAEADGHTPCNIKLLKEKISGFDVVFNTVPSVVIDKTVLDNTSPNVIMIDLASKPGGVDFEYAAKLDRKVIRALSLPGKVAPYTAGKIIKNCVTEKLAEVKK